MEHDIYQGHTWSPDDLMQVTEDLWDKQLPGCLGLKYVPKRSYLSDEPLRSEMRLTCCLQTHASYLYTRIAYLRQTWLSGCDHVVLASETDLLAAATDPDMRQYLRSVDLLRVNTTRHGYNATNELSKGSWSYLARNYLDKSDFLLYADDDGYVIVDKLRQFLKYVNDQKPLYLGHPICEPNFRLLFNNGASYVLTPSAVRLIAAEIDQGRCELPSIWSDLTDGQCLFQAGVLPSDTRDRRGGQRFVPFPLTGILDGSKFVKYSWLIWWMTTKHMAKGKDYCCSPEAFSFHKVVGRTQLIYKYVTELADN